jgi:hypothetical protein
MSRCSVENPKSRAGVWERVAGQSFYRCHENDFIMHNRERRMKITVVSILFIGTCFLIGFNGCTNESSVGPLPQTTDQQVLRQQVTTIDSVADFSTSDEATIDDNGLQAPDYDGSAIEAVLHLGHVSSTTVDSLSPFRWGRHINWTAIVRNYNVVMLGDTAALVTITKTIPGQFWVGFGTVVNDTVVIDTVVKKPFMDTVTRKVLFQRIAKTTNREKNWRPVAITLVEGRSQTANSFSITSLEITDPSTKFDTTITDPLNSWFKLGLFRGSVPEFAKGDSITLRVTIASSDDSSEVVMLRHSVEGRGSVHRVRMSLISTTGGAGNYTRLYEENFSANLPAHVLAARFNAIVDVFSHGSIYSIPAPFENEYWGSPYIAFR